MIRSTVFLALAVTARVACSQTMGSVSVVGGASTDARGVRSNAATIAPSVIMVSGAHSAASLGAHGTMFENGGWSAGLNAVLLNRKPLGDVFALAFAGNGALTRTSFDATFGVGDLSPTVELAWRGLTVYGGAHVAAGFIAVPGAERVGPFPWASTVATESRSSIAPVYGASLRFAGSDPRNAVTFWVRDDPMRIENDRIEDRTAGVSVSANRLTLGGSFGERLAPDGRTRFASATASLALSSAFSVDVAGGSYPSDRITGAAGGKFMSAGLRMRFGGGAPRLPSPSGVSRPAEGMTRLAIRAREAKRVEILGDWNGWQPVFAQRSDNGVWYADVRLAPGEYRYAFRIDGRDWRVPDGATAVDDGFGSKSAYVTVRGTR